MKRPLVWMLAFLSAGITAGYEVTGAPPAALLFACAVVAAFALYKFYAASLRASQKQSKAAILMLTAVLPIVFTVGFFGVRANEATPTAPSTVFRLSGIVENAELTSGGYHGLTIKPDDPAATGGLRVYVLTDADIPAGAQVKAVGELQNLSPARNPGGYDERLYLRTRGVGYKMLFPVMSETSPPKTTFAALMCAARDKLAAVYDAALPAQEAAVAKSMVMGDTKGLDGYIKQLYHVAGIYHILVVSGLNITLLTLGVNFILGRWLGKRRAVLITLPVLVLYCLFTGANPGCVRSVIMCSVLLIGGLFPTLDADGITSTAFAALCILLARPLYLFDIGFQYSFVGVFALIAFAPKREEHFWRDSLISATAATVCTLPVLMYWFFDITPYAILTNIIILPTVSVTMVAAAAVGAVGLFSQAAATFVAGVPFAILKLYEGCCAFFASLPLADINIGRPPLVCALGLFVPIFAFGFKNTRKKFFLPSVLAYALVCLGFLLAPKPTEVVMLDVGQGDAFVIRDGNYNFVIDGGGSLTAALGDNTGVNVLIPYLNYAGITELDAVFLSHMDADHSSGIVELLDYGRKKIDRVCVADGTELIPALQEAVDKNKISVADLKAGDEVTAGDSSFTCVWPPAGGSTSDGTNGNCLVLKYIADNSSFLFTGDIDAATEQAIVESGADIAADILKLAHHGSKNSNSEIFLRAVAPKAAIVSAGINNAFGHPSPETVDRLNALGIPMYLTATCGAVTCEIGGGEIRIRKEIYELYRDKSNVSTAG